MIFVSRCYTKAIETHLTRLSIVFLQSLYVTTFASHRQSFPDPKFAVLAM
jgi:hypothetical protein